MARITGNVAGLDKLLNQCGWQKATCPDETVFFQLMASGGNSHNND